MYSWDFIGAIQEAVGFLSHEFGSDEDGFIEYLNAEFNPNHCIYVTALVYRADETPVEVVVHVRSHGIPGDDGNYIVTLVK